MITPFIYFLKLFDVVQYSFFLVFFYLITCLLLSNILLFFFFIFFCFSSLHLFSSSFFSFSYLSFFPLPINFLSLPLFSVSFSVRLESTSLVLIYGGLDIFFSRISPSQGFDVLASDFNHPLLIFLLLMLAFGVFALKRIHVAKTLKQSWA